MKALVPVGCAAALAAAFNTPIAAVLFSLEEILGDMHAPVLGSVVLSSATSWMVLHLILGDEPLFHVPAYQLVNPLEFGIYAVLGVVGGLGSVAFVKLLLGLRLWFRRLPKSTVWVQPVAGGLLVGLLGWFVPEVLGVGYDYVDRVLGGDVPLQTVALLAVLKIIATPALLLVGKRGRHLRAEPVHRRDDRRGGRRSAHTRCCRRSRRIPALMRWWAWGRRLRGSCARRSRR